MKKMNQKGFVLAETLVVTVFLMIIFTMIYQNFYPLIGEYEKRENYNDIDSTYSIYWIKKLIEDPSYRIESPEKKQFFQQYGFVRFECNDIVGNDNQKKTCIDIVKALEISNCNKNGNYCDIFITDYKIGGAGSKFKTVAIQDNKNLALRRYQEEGSQDNYVKKCLQDTCPACSLGDNTEDEVKCIDRAEKKIFSSGFQDYVKLLPDYTTPSLNNAKYRVIAILHHHKDNNNYYTYSTMEINKKQTSEEAAATTEKTYTLTYANDPDNTCIPPAIIVNGDGKTWNSAGVLCTPRRKGYTFLSWNTKEDGSGTTFTGDEVATKDMTIYAQYKTNKVLIKFNTNGGILGTEHNAIYSLSGDNVILNNETDIIQTIDYDHKMGNTGLADYNNKNYLNIEKTGLMGKSGAEWNTQPDGNGTSFSQSEGGIQDSRFCDASEGDCTVTLYVNWTPKTLTTTFNCNGGTVTNGGNATTTTQTFTYNGGSQNFTKSCTRTGYTQLGWAASSTATTKTWNTNNQVTNNWINANAPSNTIYAVWAPKTATITFNCNGGTVTGGGTATTATQTFTYDGGSQSFSKSCTWSGHTQLGWAATSTATAKSWNTNSGVVNSWINSHSPTATIYAVWKWNTYTITYNGNGNTGGSTSSTTCTHNQDCNLRNNGFTKTWSTFVGWYTAATGGTKINSPHKFTSAQTLYAHWTGWELITARYPVKDQVWKYMIDNVYQTGWKQLKDFDGNSKWFYFDSNGESVTGWIELDKKWYWLSDIDYEGNDYLDCAAACNGTFTIKGKKYTFDKNCVCTSDGC